MTAGAARELKAEIRDAVHRALEEPLSRLEAALRTLEHPDETVDVDGAAELLHTTPRAIRMRRQRGQMPTPLTRRPLVWRKADLLRSRK